MSLVGRGIARVAARGRDQAVAREVERGADLLAARQARDPHRPAPGHHLPPARQRELADLAVRGCGINEPAAPVGDRRGVGDPVRALQRADPGRREGPQPVPVTGVERERAPVARGRDEHVALLPLHLDTVEVDGRRVDGPGDRYVLALQVRDVTGRDARARRGGVGARGIEPEAGPVVGRGEGRGRPQAEHAASGEERGTAHAHRR